MSRKLKYPEMAKGGIKFFRYLAAGGLLNINLEVTKRCNARCDFCDYWKEKPGKELKDYVAVVKRLDPLSVSLTGGEPLLREDLAEIIGSLRRSCGFLFISLITNGALLTVERGRELWEAGLDEFSISLDYMDARHDRARGLPGLVEHIFAVAGPLRDSGVNLCFNMVMKRGNFQEMPQMVRAIADRGIKVSLSTYNCWRIRNEDHMLDPGELAPLRGVVRELKEIRRTRGNLTTGEYYLERIPEFFEKRGIAGCTAGLNWVQVTPDGQIKRCSDHPAALHFSQWRRGFFAPTRCDRCWYSCRGAAQEPLTLSRFVEMAREALG